MRIPFRNVLLVCFLALSAKVMAQDAANNAGTNQPASQAAPSPTPEAPVPLLPVAPAPAQMPYTLTNQLQTLPVPPPITGPTATGSPTPLQPLMGTSAISGPPSAVGAIPLGPGIPLWGPIDFHPHLLYTLLYGNGVQAQPGQQSKGFINEVAPGVLFDFGKQWSLNYTPTFRFYSNPLFHDGTDESVVLAGSANYRDWIFSLSQTYVQSSQPLVETGVQTDQELYATAIGATYQMGSKTSLDLGVSQNFRLTQQFSSLHEWSTHDWLNYQAEPQVGLGVGLTGGYDEVSDGSDMPFEQVQGRINFRPGSKLAIMLSGGVEDRQFVGPSAPPLISPIFSASLQYQLFQATSISLTAGRTVTPSFFGNEVQVVTSVNAAINQQLSRKFSVDLSGGYTTEPFTSIVAGPLPQYYLGAPPRTALQVVRTESTPSARVSLSYAATLRASFSAFYTIRKNTSGQSAFNYTSHQGGLSFNYRY